MTGRLLQVLVFVVAFVGLAATWGAYEQLESVSFIFRRSFGTAIPIYARHLELVLDDPAVVTRLWTAIGVTIGSVALVTVAALRRWPVWICLLLAVSGTIATDTSLAHIRGGSATFVAPYLRRGLEYYLDVPRVNDSPLTFIRNYAQLSPTLSLHAGTHPPGGVLFLWAGEKLFGTGPAAAAWWSVGVGALGVIPTYWLARMIIGASRARRAIPIHLVTTSLAIFGATSLDIVFFTFAATALATLFWAMHRGSTARILLAGFAYWLAAFMTFAVIALPLIAGCFALLSWTQDRRKAAARVGRLALVGLAFIFFQAIARLFLGYDFLLVADAAMTRDFRGVGVTGYESVALWWAYSFSNLFAFLVGSGIALSAAMVVGISTALAHRPFLRRRRWRLSIATALALLMLATCTLFTLETERVWLGVLPAMIAIAAGLRGNTLWLLTICLLALQTIWTECTLYTHW